MGDCQFCHEGLFPTPHPLRDSVQPLIRGPRLHRAPGYQLFREMSITPRYRPTFTARLWRYPGAGGWVFAPVPEEHAPPATHPWGRTPVRATVDGHTWNTSVWRGKDGRTLLAVPQKVRGARDDGDEVVVTIEFDAL